MICPLCGKQQEDNNDYGITLSKKVKRGKYRSRGIYSICDKCGKEIENKLK